MVHRENLTTEYTSEICSRFTVSATKSYNIWSVFSRPSGGVLGPVGEDDVGARAAEGRSASKRICPRCSNNKRTDPFSPPGAPVQTTPKVWIQLRGPPSVLGRRGRFAGSLNWSSGKEEGGIVAIAASLSSSSAASTIRICWAVWVGSARIESTNCVKCRENSLDWSCVIREA